MRHYWSILRSLSHSSSSFSGKGNVLLAHDDTAQQLYGAEKSFAYLLCHSIIGVQAFKGSLSRRCVLATNETEVLEDQFCGGHYDLSRPYPSYEAYITKSGELSQTSPKGHICSHGYICKVKYQDVGNSDGLIPERIKLNLLCFRFVGHWSQHGRRNFV